MRANFWAPILTTRTQPKNARIPRIRILITTVSVGGAAHTSPPPKYIYIRSVKSCPLRRDHQRKNTSLTTSVGANKGGRVKDLLTPPYEISLDDTKVDRRWSHADKPWSANLTATCFDEDIYNDSSCDPCPFIL